MVHLEHDLIHHTFSTHSHYMSKDGKCRPTKLDYLCVFNRWKSMIINSEEKWGPSCFSERHVALVNQKNREDQETRLRGHGQTTLGSVWYWPTNQNWRIQASKIWYTTVNQQYGDTTHTNGQRLDWQRSVRSQVKRGLKGVKIHCTGSCGDLSLQRRYWGRQLQVTGTFSTNITGG